MMTRLFLSAICLSLSFVSTPASAGSAGSGSYGGGVGAATGPGSPSGSASSAGADSSGRLTKINQYSVKSYALLRQMVVASGNPADPAVAPAGPPAR